MTQYTISIIRLWLSQPQLSQLAPVFTKLKKYPQIQLSEHKIVYLLILGLLQQMSVLKKKGQVEGSVTVVRCGVGKLEISKSGVGKCK
jgi:hypothetical protein